MFPPDVERRCTKGCKLTTFEVKRAGYRCDVCGSSENLRAIDGHSSGAETLPRASVDHSELFHGHDSMIYMLKAPRSQGKGLLNLVSGSLAHGSPWNTESTLSSNCFLAQAKVMLDFLWVTRPAHAASTTTTCADFAAANPWCPKRPLRPRGTISNTCRPLACTRSGHGQLVM